MLKFILLEWTNIVDVLYVIKSKKYLMFYI